VIVVCYLIILIVSALVYFVLHVAKCVLVVVRCSPAWVLRVIRAKPEEFQ
jgi:hypothetical protein